MPSKFHNSKGFTLLELLVVISIIGLMASVVLVSLDIAREKAVVAKGLQFGSSIYHAHGDELVGFWNFNETGENTCSGGEDACDASGFGNHGTFQNGAAHNNDSPNSALGRSVEFDGVDDYVNCGNDESLGISDEITIESWVNINGWSATLEIIVLKPGAYTLRYFDDTNFIAWISIGGTNHVVAGSTKPILGKWYHVVTTYNGTNLKLFVDGKEDKIPTVVSGKIDTVISNFSIGFPAFNGLIDEVRIYKTALSSAEIQKHYAEGAKRHGITRNK